MTDHMIQADYVEAVASEYLKQGLPMGIVQEMVQCDPRSSTSLLPPPPTTGCPMSITPMALYEGRVNTRPPSRMSSNTSLPLLGESIGRFGGLHVYMYFAIAKFLVKFLSNFLVNFLSNFPAITVVSYKYIYMSLPPS